MPSHTFAKRLNKLMERLDLSLLGHHFTPTVKYDRKNNDWYDSRAYIQIEYSAACTKTGLECADWKGRKYYLSEHMTDDEIVKTAYVAFESAVKHEIMEGFKVDGKVLFNPHVNFEELLAISHKEIKREEPKEKNKEQKTLSTTV